MSLYFFLYQYRIVSRCFYFKVYREYFTQQNNDRWRSRPYPHRTKDSFTRMLIYPSLNSFDSLIACWWKKSHWNPHDYRDDLVAMTCQSSCSRSKVKLVVESSREFLFVEGLFFVWTGVYKITTQKPNKRLKAMSPDASHVYEVLVCCYKCRVMWM